MRVRIQIALMSVLVTGLLGVTITRAQGVAARRAHNRCRAPRRHEAVAGVAGAAKESRGGISGRGAAEPTLWLPDDQFIRWPYSDPAYSKIDGFKIKGYINEITAISRKSRDDGNQYWGRSDRHVLRQADD